MNPDYSLNCQRLLCPMPVIKTQNKIKTMSNGETLEVIATDPGTKEDIPAWCRINGHEILSIEENERDYYFMIKVAGNMP